MNSILKEQIRTYLPEKFRSDKDLNFFFEFISMSYNKSEEQKIKLKKESYNIKKENEILKTKLEGQEKIIDKLNTLITQLDGGKLDLTEDIAELHETFSLINLIDDQNKEISSVNNQKNALLANLKKQNTELSYYTHMFSHDLRTQLQSLEALTEWLKTDYEDSIDEGGLTLVNSIKSVVEKIDNLVHSVFEFTNIDKNFNKKREIDLNDFLDKLISSIRNPNNIKIKIQENLPIINGDFYRLNLLFTHLIDNAIKNNDKGENGIVEILFQEDEKYWQFCVKDNGKGIESKYIDKIFSPFQKLDNDDQSAGIGLSIAKKIVEIYYGNIEIKSNPGSETLVIFSLRKKS